MRECRDKTKLIRSGKFCSAKFALSEPMPFGRVEELSFPKLRQLRDALLFLKPYQSFKATSKMLTFYFIELWLPNSIFVLAQAYFVSSAIKAEYFGNWALRSLRWPTS
jgi:hypothetical protein